MSEKTRKLVQTSMLLILSSFEILLIFLSHIDIIHNTDTTIYMVNLTLMFMVVVQLLWLQNYNNIAFIICHVYFALMCVLLYYANSIIDVCVFAINILVLLDTVLVRGKSVKRSKKEE